MLFYFCTMSFNGAETHLLCPGRSGFTGQSQKAVRQEYVVVIAFYLRPRLMMKGLFRQTQRPLTDFKLPNLTQPYLNTD